MHWLVPCHIVCRFDIDAAIFVTSPFDCQTWIDSIGFCRQPQALSFLPHYGRFLYVIASYVARSCLLCNRSIGIPLNFLCKIAHPHRSHFVVESASCILKVILSEHILVVQPDISPRKVWPVLHTRRMSTGSVESNAVPLLWLPFSLRSSISG